MFAGSIPKRRVHCLDLDSDGFAREIGPVGSSAANRSGHISVTAVTLALQGGGIRALASDAGLVAGIARVSHLSHLSHNESINKQSGDSDQTKMDTLNVMRVLQNFDTVSSVSGSSWFAAELFFSNSFVELLKGVLSLCCLCSLSHPLNTSHLSPNARLDQSMFSHINLVLALALHMCLRCLC